MASYEKDSPLGEEARFRNAKLAYYRGDFEWTQTQLEALKSSTSELISNDAINLSVFIIDNLGMDTSETPMQMFAHAELLMYQNKMYWLVEQQIVVARMQEVAVVAGQTGQ